MSKDTTFAFPVSPEIWATHHDFCGMTLRDYFAGQALAGYFASPSTPHMNAEGPDAAAYLYAMADAMLAARTASAPELQMQHVAYYDDGKFEWMSGVAPRDCELFAPVKTGGAL